jgi:hypothetical protein
MFDQFRQQYPQGCISSDLVQIHENRYVVRVAIQSEGIPLAAALAVDADLAIAQDQATLKALAIVGIKEHLGNVNSEISIASLPTVEAIWPGQRSANDPTETLPIMPLPIPKVLEVPPTATDEHPPEFYDQSEESTLEVEEEFSFAAADLDEEELPVALTPEPEEVEPETVLEVTTPPIAKAGKSPKKTAVEAEPIPEPATPISNDPPLTVTDMIPLINMELKRLGWSKDQGRDYMVKLYNKRASALLSDEELFGLLQHLQAESV